MTNQANVSDALQVEQKTGSTWLRNVTERLVYNIVGQRFESMQISQFYE